MTRLLKIFAFVFVGAHVVAGLAVALGMTGPMYLNDFALMIYQQHRGAEFFGAFHNFWGYDPTFSAGYPLNFTWSSNVVLQVGGVLMSPAPEYISLLVITVVSVLLAPFCFRAGAANFGLRGSALNSATILATAYWWCSLFMLFMYMGMPAALLVFHISFYVVSLFYRLLRDGDSSVLTRIYVLATFCFLAHKTAIIIIGLPVFIMFVIYIRRQNLYRLLHLAGIAAVVVAVNSFWLVPFLHLVHFKVSLPDAPHGLCMDPLRIFKDFFTFSKVLGHKILYADNEGFIIAIPNTIIRDTVTLFGIIGIGTLWKKGAKSVAAFFTILTAIFMAEIYFGSFWAPAAMLYPTRYISYMDFFLIIPAAVALESLWRTRLAARRRLVTVLSTIAVVVLLVCTLPVYIFFFHRLDMRLDEDTKAVTALLQSETAGTQGRIMLEDSGWNDSDGLPPKYSESHFPSLIADITGKEMIGGPYPYVFLQHHYADFHDGKFLDRPIEDYSGDELERALDDYYVRWITCWSADCKEVFLTSPEIYTQLGTAGKFVLFERNNFDPNPFLEGDGYIFADHRGMRCLRVRPEDGRAVLKYHAFEPLATNYGAKGAPHGVQDDPVGFISFDDPAPYFSVVNTYRFSSW